MFGLMPNGILRQANLRMLFERAKQYETSSFKGLYYFIRFVEKLKLTSGDMGAAKIIGENDNVVRIMSIHKSKGLEFPVVFLASTGKQINLMDLNQNILLHQDLGIGAKNINYERQIQFDTLSKIAIKSKVYTETLAEEMRILYVALTRAKEKLVITGITKDYEEQRKKIFEQIERYPRQREKINSILVKKYIKYIDWILLAYFYDENNISKITQLKVHSKKETLDFCKELEDKDINLFENIKKSKKNKENLQELEYSLNMPYEYELSTKIPTKSSVTQIKQGNQEPLEITFPSPKFLQNEKSQKLTAAQKGTLLHLCLQKLDIKEEYNLELIKKLIQNLVENEIITEKESENINLNSILDFTKTKIWKEMKQAKEIYKEKPFYITVKAKELYEKEVEDDILIQGIIDLYYINQKDELILVDYKTDFVENEEKLIQKYKPQLTLYKKALEESYSKKVKHCYLYSTFLRKEIEIIK